VGTPLRGGNMAPKLTMGDGKKNQKISVCPAEDSQFPWTSFVEAYQD
jgi:hypothetical protein